MDNYGRIEDGNINDINIKDDTMPFGIRTDYNKLTTETKTLYENNDALFVDLGDTYRLDEYKELLNENTYAKMKRKILRLWPSASKKSIRWVFRSASFSAAEIFSGGLQAPARV